MQAGLGAGDRDKLDEYFSSVRELEQRLAAGEEWSQKPKPKVEAKQPQNAMNAADLVGKTKLLFDLDAPRLPDRFDAADHDHAAGHEPGAADSRASPTGTTTSRTTGRIPASWISSRNVELEKMKMLADLLGKLKQSQEAGGSLLDRTSVFFSSNLGNASSHSCKNLPVMLAGGGFKHGQHLASDPTTQPLSNLYVSLLQRLGLETDEFGTSTGTLTGLELAG